MKSKNENHLLVSLLSSHSTVHRNNTSSSDVKQSNAVAVEDGSKPKDKTKRRRRRLPSW